MTSMNRAIVLAARPQGEPKESDFRLVELERPRPKNGEVLVRTCYLSVDPYMRARIREGGSYASPVEIGQTMIGGTVGRVIESQHSAYKQNDVVRGYWGWQEFAAVNGRDVEPFDTSIAPMSTSVGILGMPGMTAYFGLLDVGCPRPGDTVFITGAAGAVGSAVGQIAKIAGCRVAGSAGSKEKVDWLIEELGFDAAFNYKDTKRYGAKLREVCPDGIDVFFDNVGGALSDAAFARLNAGARIVVCGQIDQYNATEAATGPRLLFQLIAKRARAEGFLVFQFKDRYPEAARRMAGWIREGRLNYKETIVDGLENATKAFIGLFHGDNIGKMVVRVSDESP